tara:strand:+ start:371 stop:577 length:207 start_codon:yes stop_codon:yes gene_type:complete
MEQVLKLIENYGITLVLLVGCLYALYQFFWFSVREVKNTFQEEHKNKNKVLAEIQKKIDIILELLKRK